MVSFFVKSRACSSEANAAQLLDRLFECGFLFRSSQVAGGGISVGASFAELITHSDDDLAKDNADRHWVVRIDADASFAKLRKKEEGTVLSERSGEVKSLKEWTEQSVDLFLEQTAIKLSNDKRYFCFCLWWSVCLTRFGQCARSSS